MDNLFYEYNCEDEYNAEDWAYRLKSKRETPYHFKEDMSYNSNKSYCKKDLYSGKTKYQNKNK